jgi:phage-related protein
MPRIAVYLYQEQSGEIPVLDWLRGLNRRNRKAVDACLVRVRLLQVLGHELRRPHADLLRGGIHELRARTGRVNCRILYFFHGQDAAVLAHALTKEDRVPDADIERAVQRKRRYEQEPEEHRAREALPEEASDL